LSAARDHRLSVSEPEGARPLRAVAPTAWIVAVTGYGQLEDRLRARRAGFDHHLVKPVDPSALIELLGDLDVQPL
jgi:two-component system CheB/CheR fusion protein